MTGFGLFLAASIISVPTPPGLPSTDITAHHGTIYETRKAGEPTQGFLTIENVGEDDRLTGAVCPLADVTSVVGVAGRPVDDVPIPAHRNVTLSEDGPHLLLQNTHFSVEFGGIVPCSLTFANAGTISVFLYAEPAP